MDRTRIVRWLRVLLPLLALALLSSLFLLGREPGTQPSIPYAQVDAEQMAREPRMTQPEYSGVTKDGAAITLRAAQAVPSGGSNGDGGGGSGGTASVLRMTWRAPDGLAADLTAPEADMQAGAIALRGGVQMTTSSGWALTAPRLDSATDQSRIEARDGIQGFAPFGQIQAGQMVLHRPAGDTTGKAHVLDFTGGVRLLYQP